MRFEVGVDGIGQTAYQQIAAEQVEHMVMVLFRKALAILVGLAKHVNSLRAEAVGNQELLEIELEHILDGDAAHRNRGGVLQGDTQQTATGDIAVAVILTQELQHGEVLRIVLNLVEKHQCIFAVVELVACHHAKGQIKVFLLMDVLEELLTLVILHEVDLHEVRVETCTHLTNTERLTYLAGSLQYQNLVIIGLQIVLDVRCNLPVQHGYLHFSITFGSQKLHFSIKYSAAKLHFSIKTTKQIGKKVQK